MTIAIENYGECRNELMKLLIVIGFFINCFPTDT